MNTPPPPVGLLRRDLQRTCPFADHQILKRADPLTSAHEHHHAASILAKFDDQRMQLVPGSGFAPEYRMAEPVPAGSQGVSVVHPRARSVRCTGIMRIDS